MFPVSFEILGERLDIWDLTLLAALLVGYRILIGTFREPASNPPPKVRLLWLRYLVTAYLALISAQLFSYAFDLDTTLFSPRGMNPVYYYLSPTAGAKTLYGAALTLPLSVFLISTPWRDVAYRVALDRWTPTLFCVLALARVGCFLQGCCYGLRSETFGIVFPPDSVVYYAQLRQGLVRIGSPTLPVVPTQIIEAIALIGLCAWSYRRVRAGHMGIYFSAVAAYSLVRFLVEIVRDDPTRNYLGPLSTSQWIALIVLSAYGLRRVLKHLAFPYELNSLQLRRDVAAREH